MCYRKTYSKSHYNFECHWEQAKSTKFERLIQTSNWRVCVCQTNEILRGLSLFVTAQKSKETNFLFVAKICSHHMNSCWIESNLRIVTIWRTLQGCTHHKSQPPCTLEPPEQLVEKLLPLLTQMRIFLSLIKKIWLHKIYKYTKMCEFKTF